MEVSVYFYNEKPLFKRVIMCPDAFDIKAFHSCMKAMFGEKIVVSVILT